MFSTLVAVRRPGREASCVSRLAWPSPAQALARIKFTVWRLHGSLLDVAWADDRTGQRLVGGCPEAADEDAGVPAGHAGPARPSGQWLGNHGAAGDDVGAVDVGLYRAVGLAACNEPTQHRVDACPGGDRGVVDIRRCSAQRQHQLIAQVQAFVEEGVYRVGPVCPDSSMRSSSAMIMP